MKKVLLVFCGTVGVTASLIGCSGDSLVNDVTPATETNSAETLSDQVAEEKGVLSEDDAEVLIYEQLSDEEKQTVTVDFTGTEGTKYLIRTIEKVDGLSGTREEYTVDFNTGEVKQLK